MLVKRFNPLNILKAYSHRGYTKTLYQKCSLYELITSQVLPSPSCLAVLRKKWLGNRLMPSGLEPRLENPESAIVKLTSN